MTNEVMTNEDAIIRLKNIDIRNALQEDYDALYMAIKALEQTRWIPVSEKLPEIGQRILVTYNQEDEVKIDITDYTKHGFLLSVVKAWMPLPQPYKAESEG